jgi:uncharacterized protein involved in exopolysaccharide biosynthesis
MNGDLEISEVTGALRRGLGRIVIGCALGLAGGLAVYLFAPARFDGAAMVLVRTAPNAKSALASQFGPLAELAGGALGLGDKGDDLETELALLQSRTLIGMAVDSLGLQVRAGRTPALALARPEAPAGRFRPQRVTLDGVRARLVDREDAIDDTRKRLAVRELGGDVVQVRFRARDSLTAAALPNLLVARYLERRRTVDRGLNQRRLEFLLAQSDSARRALRDASARLRRAQQSTGVLSVELTGRAEAEAVGGLQVELAALRGEALALDSLLRTAGTADPRTLAGFPALLRSPAVNEIVVEMSRLETERTLALADLTEEAPRVRALTAARDSLRAQLAPLARAYAASLDRQQEQVLSELATRRRASGTLSAAGEQLLLLEAEVKALVQLSLAVETQLLEARLAALAEGGDVRLVDPAVEPRRADFPRRSLSLLAGLILGAAAGLAWALTPIAAPRDPLAR